jgi:hypothetical protein
MLLKKILGIHCAFLLCASSKWYREGGFGRTTPLIGEVLEILLSHNIMPMLY